MLKLLLDEHISPAVAVGVRRRAREVVIHAVRDWSGGILLGEDDAVCLKAAAAQSLTLVTYDRRTIAPLLRLWAEEGVHHTGVIFVDQKTIPQGDIGGLVWALSALAQEAMHWDWADEYISCTLRVKGFQKWPTPISA